MHFLKYIEKYQKHILNCITQQTASKRKGVWYLQLFHYKFHCDSPHTKVHVASIIILCLTIRHLKGLYGFENSLYNYLLVCICARNKTYIVIFLLFRISNYNLINHNRLKQPIDFYSDIYIYIYICIYIILYYIFRSFVS